MRIQDVAVQLVDLPPLCDEHVEPWVYDLVRAADMAWLVVSLDDPLGGIETVDRLLQGKALRLVPPGAEDAVERRPGWTHLRTLLVVTGADRPGAADDLAVMEELLDGAWRWTAVSATTGEGLETLARTTFEALEVIRVYTKQPGHEPDLERPYTLPKGATVAALARAIHADLAEQLRFARIWGAAAFAGQHVPGDHELVDGDVVELRS
jgi:ribosome-interacting GTPase 1